MSDTQYLIRKIEMCPVCNGDKFLPNKDWQEINKANNAWMELRGIKVFNEAAHMDWERRIREKWPHQKPPPEEEPCHECEGEGKIETWIDLREALQELGVLPSVGTLHTPGFSERFRAELDALARQQIEPEG